MFTDRCVFPPADAFRPFLPKKEEKRKMPTEKQLNTLLRLLMNPKAIL